MSHRQKLRYLLRILKRNASNIVVTEEDKDRMKQNEIQNPGFKEWYCDEDYSDCDSKESGSDSELFEGEIIFGESYLEEIKKEMELDKKAKLSLPDNK